MQNENDFIHEIVNTLTIAHSKTKRIQNKLNTLSRESLVEELIKIDRSLERTFNLIKERKDFLVASE